MELKEKLPAFLKIVSIVGFVLIGLNLMSSASFFKGPLTVSEIEQNQLKFMEMFNVFPQKFKELLKPILNVMELLERNYVYSKVIPFFAMLIVWIGNLLIRRRKLIGMHLIISGIIAACVSTYMAVRESDMALIYAIFNFLLFFVYAALVVVNRKYLS
jgi:hypothetical protein